MAVFAPIPLRQASRPEGWCPQGGGPGRWRRRGRKVADLALLDADPLADISNMRRIAVVVLWGRLFDRAGLETILAAVDTMPDQTVNDWVRRN